MMNKFLPLFLLLCIACYRVPQKIEPQINYQLEDEYIKSLKSFSYPLSDDEKKEEWGKEFTIGLAFAKQLDLYRAISTFKRAEILLPPGMETRRLEISYFILLCYFLGEKHERVVETFEKSNLSQTDKSFPPFHDLLIILYDSYNQIKDENKKSRILEVLNQNFPKTKKEIMLSSALLNGEVNKLDKIATISPSKPYLTDMLDKYHQEKKSIATAQILNAIIPGGGYLYINQKRSALTSFLLNGLFIAASYQFFHKGYIAAGIITTSFELGWYIGGIYGAGEEAKLYNERIYEKYATGVMHRQHLFPTCRLKFAF